MESPKGKAEKRAGKDALPGQGHLIRAEVSHPAFQRFRIAAQVANLRIENPATGDREKLPREVRAQLIDYRCWPI